MSQPPLKPLHPDSSLSPAKLALFRKRSTDALLASLNPGQKGALQTRPDGTLIEGHHRIVVLRERKIDVDALPREVIEKKSV